MAWMAARPPPPVSNWGNSFTVARESVENHIEAHDQYLAARGDRERVPPLVDLTAERLTHLALDDVDGIPPVMLESYLWRWHKIPYSAMRRAVLTLSSKGLAPDALEGSPKSVDGWILMNEKWLRDGNQAKWQQGLVTLIDFDNAFPSSVLSDSCRTIIRPDSIPGYEVLCEAREPHIRIQPSADAFKRTFERMSDGLLKNLDWNNLFVAGGIILGTLLSVDAPDGQPHCDPRWASSDIDMYVYGLSPSEANQKVKHLFETFHANLPPGTPTLVVRNCTTITFYARYPLRRIQIVLKLTESPKSVLLNFDLDACAMGWDGATLWMLPRAARALETGYNVFTMSVIHGHYLSNRRASTPERIFKYADKGYGLRILPFYVSSLATRNPTPPNNRPHSGGTDLPRPDIFSVAVEARNWTAQFVDRWKNRGSNVLSFNMAEFGQSFLSSFSTFMRWVALWEMGRRGEVTVSTGTWASSSYRDALTTYDDPSTTRYPWDEKFDIDVFQQHIHNANEDEIWNWVETDFHDRLFLHGVDSAEDLSEKFQRTICAPTVAALLSKKRDIMMQVLLPCDFAVYANDVVSRAQASAGMRETKLLMPAVHGFNFIGNSDPQTDGLFFWRIGAGLMWQQFDRKVDEVFEALYAFRKVNEHLRSNEAFQAPRLRRELARRAVYDELDSFALWVVS
ncbi:hypothetical protein B0H11DRAFT_1951216 [Mycena galericulata]|nr:hypothetical protein B0H11DRAFT_1951216 [Mycena galericulata]